MVTNQQNDVLIQARYEVRELFFVRTEVYWQEVHELLHPWRWNIVNHSPIDTWSYSRKPESFALLVFLKFDLKITLKPNVLLRLQYFTDTGHMLVVYYTQTLGLWRRDDTKIMCVHNESCKKYGQCFRYACLPTLPHEQNKNSWTDLHIYMKHKLLSYASTEICRHIPLLVTIRE
jgi:hypothetical protein